MDKTEPEKALQENTPGAEKNATVMNRSMDTKKRTEECTMTGIVTGNDDNKTPGPDGSGEQGTAENKKEYGQNSMGAVETRKTAARTKTASLPAVRATALRGQDITRHQSPKSTYRRQTQQDIYGKDPEIPYVKFEAVFRDLVCSLMERQDRMTEEIFLKLNDHGYQIEDLQQELLVRGGAK